jgi:hypothetical protein
MFEVSRVIPPRRREVKHFPYGWTIVATSSVQSDAAWDATPARRLDADGGYGVAVTG